MPPFGQRKPKLSLPAPSVDVIAARKTMFDSWITECSTQWEDAVIELVLSQFPSARGDVPHGG